MTKIINDIISVKNKLNFEYMISILRENYKNFYFLVNKRIHNTNNQYNISQNQNLEYLNIIIGKYLIIICFKNLIKIKKI